MQLNVTCPGTTTVLYVLEYDTSPTEVLEADIQSHKIGKEYNNINTLSQGTVSLVDYPANTGKYVAVCGYTTVQQFNDKIEITSIAGYKTSCLSGDTLITMADNSK
jgi:hypothetical protein